MTTTTTPRGASFAHTAAMLTGHLADHALPEPASLSLTTSYGHPTLTAQLRSTTVPALAADLLAWANTLSVVTIEAWRPPEGNRVHLCLHSTITSPTGAVTLKVFSAVDYDPHQFPDLQPHPHRGVSLSLGQLRGWAATTTNSPALEAHGARR